MRHVSLLVLCASVLVSGGLERRRATRNDGNHVRSSAFVEERGRQVAARQRTHLRRHGQHASLAHGAHPHLNADPIMDQKRQVSMAAMAYRENIPHPVNTIWNPANQIDEGRNVRRRQRSSVVICLLHGTAFRGCCVALSST